MLRFPAQQWSDDALDVPSDVAPGRVSVHGVHDLKGHDILFVKLPHVLVEEADRDDHRAFGEKVPRDPPVLTYRPAGRGTRRHSGSDS